MFHHFFLYPFPLGLIYTNKNDLIDLRSEKSLKVNVSRMFAKSRLDNLQHHH